MNIDYEARFLEECVFLALRQMENEKSDIASEYRKNADRIYQMPQSDARERAFQELHIDTFSHLRLDLPILEILAYFPRLRKALAKIVVMYAPRRKEQDVELFGNNGSWSVLAVLSPETFVSPRNFGRFAYHEFSHINDMLNPVFGYTRDFGDDTLNAQQRDMMRDRFRIIWDIYIDSRLERDGKPPSNARDWHELNFLQMFGLSDVTREAFIRLWQGKFNALPTHGAFVKGAQTPEALGKLLGIEDSVAAGGIRRFAAPCPVCGCATSVWSTESHRLPPAVNELIRGRVPSWSPEHGLCGQCVEIFLHEHAAARMTGGNRP